MPRKPGNLNPDSQAGNARLGTGRGSNAGRSQPSGANKAVPAPKKFQPPAGIKVTKTGTTYFEKLNERGYIQLKGGRWLGNRAPQGPLTDFKAIPEIKVTNTSTGVSAKFAGTPEQAVKSFIQSQDVYARLNQGFSAAIKKAK
jgi:hypothetical protein